VTVASWRQIDEATRTHLRDAISTTAYTSGSTHHFYHYPARFAPLVAREVIAKLSAPGDWVMDPFMGGGTSIVEGLALGRRMIGVDINALAHFVAEVRTRLLSYADEEAIRSWADSVAIYLAAPKEEVGWIERVWVHNLPTPVEVFMSGALALMAGLRPRQKTFARCALLRLGQLVLDCRDFNAPRRKRLAERLPGLVGEMLNGLRELADLCRRAGVSRWQLNRNRVLLHRSAVGVDDDPALLAIDTRPRLVLTSPPYPGVNVLYHRWQYRGRRETPAPYWIANVPDGYGASFYTGGSRTPTGEQNYFDMITKAFRSVARLLAPDGNVVQLVGFSNAAEQLPAYLECMRRAGLEECDGARLERRVPNRKWYAKLKGVVDASTEVMLIHRRARTE
jgi:hypothetical protein